MRSMAGSCVRISYYLDDDSSFRSLAAQAQSRGFVVKRPEDAGMRGKTDLEHLVFAAEHGFVLVTANESDFVRLHWDWVSQGRTHAGLIIAAQDPLAGERIRRLLVFLQLATAEDMANKIEYLTEWP